MSEVSLRGANPVRSLAKKATDLRPAEIQHMA